MSFSISRQKALLPVTSYEILGAANGLYCLWFLWVLHHSSQSVAVLYIRVFSLWMMYSACHCQTHSSTGILRRHPHSIQSCCGGPVWPTQHAPLGSCSWQLSKVLTIILSLSKQLFKFKVLTVTSSLFLVHPKYAYSVECSSTLCII